PIPASATGPTPKSAANPILVPADEPTPESPAVPKLAPEAGPTPGPVANPTLVSANDPPPRSAAIPGLVPPDPALAAGSYAGEAEGLVPENRIGHREHWLPPEGNGYGSRPRNEGPVLLRRSRTLPGHPVHRYRRSPRSEEHTSELQSRENLVCRLLLEKNNSRTPR